MKVKIDIARTCYRGFYYGVYIKRHWFSKWKNVKDFSIYEEALHFTKNLTKIKLPYYVK